MPTGRYPRAADFREGLAFGGEHNGDELTPQSLTLEAWAWRSITQRAGDWHNVVARQSTAGTDSDSYTLSGHGWGGDPNALTFWGTGGGTSYAGGFAASTWKYVVAARDTSGGAVYSNGNFLGALGGGNLAYGANDLLIGAPWNTGGITQGYIGYIDDVRISNVKRDATWITSQYSSMTGALLTAGAVQNRPASGVLANDTDADGDVLTAVLSAGPAAGSLTLNPDGSFSYTPNADFNGTDTFTYRLEDQVLARVERGHRGNKAASKENRHGGKENDRVLFHDFCLPSLR